MSLGFDDVSPVIGYHTDGADLAITLTRNRQRLLEFAINFQHGEGIIQCKGKFNALRCQYRAGQDRIENDQLASIHRLQGDFNHPLRTGELDIE